MRRRTSRAPRRNAGSAEERGARALRVQALRAARDRLAGRSDAWLDKRIDEQALELMAEGLSPAKVAELVVAALDAAAAFQRERLLRRSQPPARNRRRR